MAWHSRNALFGCLLGYALNRAARISFTGRFHRSAPAIKNPFTPKFVELYSIANLPFLWFYFKNCTFLQFKACALETWVVRVVPRKYYHGKSNRGLKCIPRLCLPMFAISTNFKFEFELHRRRGAAPI